MKLKYCILKVAAVSVLLSALSTSCVPAATPATPKPASAPTVAPPAAQTAQPAAPVATPKPAGDGPRSGGTLIGVQYVEPPHFDLQQSQILATRGAAIPAYDTLLEYNPIKQDEIIPDLAERYDVSPDGLTYTFYLNKGIKFHDGSPLTSEDIKYNIDRLRNPPTGILSPRSGLLASIDRVETPDNDTLKVVAKFPDASVLGGLALSHHVIYPKKTVEDKGHMKQTVMGTGPFRLDKYETGVVISYVKNKDYFRKGRPYLDGITLYIMTDSATRFAAFRTGRVMITGQGSGGLTPAQAEIAKVELKGKARTIDYVTMSNVFTHINTSRKPLDDARVRKVLAIVPDRPAITRVAWQGLPTSVFFVPSPHGKWEIPLDELAKIPGYRADKNLDIEDAKKLMADAGQSQGFSVKICVRTLSTHQRVAEMLREQYKAVGIDLQIEMLETAVWNDRKTKENYDLLLNPYGVHDDDPNAWLDIILPQGISFKDDQVDKLRSEQARTLDPAKRKTLVREMEMRLLEVLPVIPSVRSGTDTMGVWENVKNYGQPIGIWNSHKYTDVWLAQ
ncbi:MAG: ABC transporter substrate-binding protein [Chloroflexota bacterium]